VQAGWAKVHEDYRAAYDKALRDAMELKANEFNRILSDPRLLKAALPANAKTVKTVIRNPGTNLIEGIVEWKE
jgi:hypothetical protein